MSIRYEILDPRPASLSASLAQILSWKSRGETIVGFEVTVPQQAALLDLNIDPQHTGGNALQSCIRHCYENCVVLDQPQYVFCTNRADLDAVGGMVYYTSYAQNETLDFTIDRMFKAHQADIFAHGDWSPKPLFSEGYEQSELGAIARAIADFKIPLEQRVQWMSNWLCGGEAPKGYQAAYEAERTAIQSALESGETTIETKYSIAVVQSKLRAATSIGYAQAPIVVALNPEMPSKNGSYKKFTVCQYSEGYCDLKAVLADLQTLEPGWGGSPTIIGSPQEQSSALSLETVEKIVRKHRLFRACACGSQMHYAECHGDVEHSEKYCG